MIRSTSTLAFLYFALCSAPLRTAAPPFPDPHIRSSEPAILDALTRGARVSPTLRRLIARLEASDVAVYVAFDRASAPSMAGHLALLTTVPGRRYLRISIDRRVTGWQRIAILGHELQHAVEVAESRSVIDEATLAALYRRIGFRSAGAQVDCYDSVGAILAGRSVEKEVRERYTEFTDRSGVR